MYLDNRHVVRSLVLHGIVDPDIAACIEATMLEEKEEEMENRKVRDESLGAEESVWYLRQEVKSSLIEKTLAGKQNLSWKLKDGTLTWLRLRGIISEYISGRLHIEADNANVAYGEGIMRKHDLTFQSQEKDVPTKSSRHESSWKHTSMYTDSECEERVYRVNRAGYGASEWSENFCFGVWLVEWRLRPDRRDKTWMNRDSVG